MFFANCRDCAVFCNFCNLFCYLWHLSWLFLTAFQPIVKDTEFLPMNRLIDAVWQPCWLYLVFRWRVDVIDLLTSLPVSKCFIVYVYVVLKKNEKIRKHQLLWACKAVSQRNFTRRWRLTILMTSMTMTVVADTSLGRTKRHIGRPLLRRPEAPCFYRVFFTFSEKAPCFLQIFAVFFR